VHNKKDPAGEGGAKGARGLFGRANKPRAGRKAYEVRDPGNLTKKRSDPKVRPYRTVAARATASACLTIASGTLIVSGKR
jgi:hypothetical protein